MLGTVNTAGVGFAIRGLHLPYWLCLHTPYAGARSKGSNYLSLLRLLFKCNSTYNLVGFNSDEAILKVCLTKLYTYDNRFRVIIIQVLTQFSRHHFPGQHHQRPIHFTSQPQVSVIQKLGSRIIMISLTGVE